MDSINIETILDQAIAPQERLQRTIKPLKSLSEYHSVKSSRWPLSTQRPKLIPIVFATGRQDPLNSTKSTPNHTDIVRRMP